MDYVLKNSIHTIIGETILADIRSQRTAYYFFVGGANVAGQTYGTTADDSYAYELETRNEIVSLKRILASDVSFVVPRYDWVSGTKYDCYDDYSEAEPATSGATSLQASKFYVLTTDFRVYKCLYNGGGVASTVKPASTSTSPFVTADGYRWKYMYAVPLSARTKFLNNVYMPVQTALTANFYSSGQITSTTILNMGSGYTTATITVAGDGVGADLVPVISNGQIVAVTINNPGSGYTYANITVVGNGINAAINATLSVGDLNTSQSDVELLAVQGSIEAFRVKNQGSGYSVATATITGDGKGATATCVIVNGKVTEVKVNNPGSGYTYATVVINGTGSGATCRAIMSPYGGHGKNAINELCATRISFYSNILNDKNQGITINNNFRNIGLIRNIKEKGNERFFNGLNGSACVVLNANGVIPANDDTLTVRDGTARFRVVQVGTSTDGGVTTPILMQNVDNYPITGNTVLLNTIGSSLNVSSVVSETIDKFSGDLLFIDNTGIDQQGGQQVIIFKTTLKF